MILRHRRARGALLLEVMLALAIFVVGSLAVLAIVDRALGSLHRARDAEHAALLARAAMARIEAGIASPQSLNGPVRGDETEEGAFEDAPRPDGGWTLEVSTEPAQVRGLTLVRVTAMRRSPGARDQVSASFTLAQLVRLSTGISLAEGGGP